ncbi:MAG: hypothetical protein ABR987_06110 [Terracidiphilus sp.]|jgi:hypothetical protein
MHAVRVAILLGLLAVSSLPAAAIRHLTVAQLEKTLASSVAKHRADDEIMREFGDFDLTERLTDATRTRICDTLHLGPQTTLALQLIGDESALLDPPAAELPADAAPDASTAGRIFDAATVYVTQTLPYLPDFLATRATYTFNDTPQVLKVNEWPVRVGLHLVKNTTRDITFRDDHEVTAALSRAANSPAASASAPAAPAVSAPPEPGLQSYGEFGQLLRLILIDAAKNKPAFHHWEKTPAGLVAVYRYAVPKTDSHYEVNYCCLYDGIRTNARQGGGRRGGGGGGVVGNQPGSAATFLRKVPGYHGSLFIDPTSGVIRRITLEADMGDGPVSRAATVIEYGPVTIGDRKFICPLRSMYVWEGPAEWSPPSSEIPVASVQALEPKGTLYVNETSFTNYHRLGSTVRVLSEAEAEHP